MLNANEVKAPKGKSPILEPGMYQARVFQVIDLGLQAQRPWKGKDKPPVNQLWVTYQIPDEFLLDEDGKEDKEKPRWVSERLNLYPLNQERAKSTLRMKAIDPTNELAGQWDKALGMPCLVQVIHSADGEYANVGSVSPVMKSQVTDDLIGEPVLFDKSNPDKAVLDELPDFLKTIIAADLTPEVATRVAPPVSEVEEDEPPY